MEYSILKIINDIFALDSPKIDESKRTQIQDFIKSAVNGDTIQDYLVINASLKQDKKGALVYILTNARLIKVAIDKDKEIDASSFLVNSIVQVRRKLSNEDKAEVEVVFHNDSFGLTYSSKDNDDNKITDFFQKVDRSLVRGVG